ncbi:hypothetical protein, partial [Microbacterium sp.]|uniref:hypothetical protein n=1 Tax=Microbacterium sp. TaxID=51671 RepID=UPI002811BF01
FKPIFDSLSEAALRGARHADAKLPQLARNHSDQLDDWVKKIRGEDRFDGKPDTATRPDAHTPGTPPPVDRTRNPDWLNERLDRTDLPYWRRRMAEGQQFNYQNHHRYPENEVRTADGKYVDSYDPPIAIVSRKNTQLDGVRPETAMRYLDEVLAKYAPSTRLADGRVLEGDPILEVPVQNGTVPQEIIDYANGLEPRVIIRDVLGNVYS